MHIYRSSQAGTSTTDGAHRSTKSQLVRLIGIVALVTTLVAALPALARADGSRSARSSAGCAGAGQATVSTTRFRKAMACLHDSERRSHGMARGLRLNRDLSRAAAKHARDMVRRHYFEHLSPNGKDHMDRIAASGYKPRAGSWSAGENLLFSRGRSTPRQLFGAWMKSTAHRANILKRCWKDFGLGVVHSSPYGEASGLTVVALFGKRQGSC